MFKLKCFGEINGKDMTLIPSNTYKVNHTNYRFEDVDDIFKYVSYNEYSIIFESFQSGSKSYIFFDKINSIEEVSSSIEVDVNKESLEPISLFNDGIPSTQKFICIARCPELDCDGIKHCIDTKEGISEKQYSGKDYCPCGNREIWEEIEDEVKSNHQSAMSEI